MAAENKEGCAEQSAHGLALISHPGAAHATTKRTHKRPACRVCAFLLCRRKYLFTPFLSDDPHQAGGITDGLTRRDDDTSSKEILLRGHFHLKEKFRYCRSPLYYPCCGLSNSKAWGGCGHLAAFEPFNPGVGRQIVDALVVYAHGVVTSGMIGAICGADHAHVGVDSCDCAIRRRWRCRMHTQAAWAVVLMMISSRGKLRIRV